MGSSMTGPPPSISVIIPVYNDAENLDRLLEILRRRCKVDEIIVADGGSSDDPRRIAGKWGATLVVSERGRGVQLNRGAAASKGEILWFLHADIGPPNDADVCILEAIDDPRVIGGAFRFRLMETRWYGGPLAFSINLRSRLLRLPFGDQGYFIRRSVFEKVGGFPDTPIMEDVGFMDRIRGEGEFVLLNAAVAVSSRRWDREGFIRATLRNWRVFIRFRLGASAESLVNEYLPEGNFRRDDPSTEK